MSINSKEVEERVVQMSFDNEGFEKKTKQTITSLDKLKSSLDFRGAAKGFDQLSSNSNILSKNINVLNNGVQSIQHEFSSLEVIGATCLVNLTNSAINAGKKMVNALTLEPVKTGFQEYETKMGAIQTILTNTAKNGTTLNEVIDALDELNLYADKTIYNFQQMTKNVGTFTAAGLDLQTSTASIQGIANLAAASGSTSQQASTAMYQLSQALSAGTVKLQDWNSVVNAGMGGTLFQDALKETAKEMGTDVDAILEKAGSFRNSLQQGWITSDVLAKTLNKFTVKGAKEYGEAMLKNGEYTEEANKALLEQAQRMEDAATKVKTFTQLWDTLKETAQSGWGKTWEIIVGDYDKAKEFFTQVNDVISPLLDKMANARNDLLEKALGSPSKWNEIVASFSKAGIGMESINKAFAKTFADKGVIKDTKEFDELLEKYGGDYSELVKGVKKEGLDNFEFINLARESLKEAVRENANYTESSMSAAEKLKTFQKVVTDVWQGDYGNQGWNKERQKALEAEGYEYERVQRLVNLVKDAKDGYALTEEDLSEEDLRSIGLTKAEIKAYLELETQIKDTDSELNAYIDSMYKAKGRELLIESLFNIGRAIKSVVKPIAEAWQSVFDPITGDDLYSAIEVFNKFTQSLILTGEKAETVKNIFRILFNVFDGVRTILSTGLRLAIGIVTRLFSAMNIEVGPLFKALADGSASLRDFIKQNDLVPRILTAIGPAIDFVGSKLKALGNYISNTGIFKGNFADTLSGILDSISNVIRDKLGGLLSLFGWAPKEISEEMNPEALGKSIENNITTVVDNVNVDVPSLLLEKIGAKSGESTKKKTIVDMIGERIVTFIKSMAIKLKRFMVNAFTWVANNINPAAIISSALILTMMKTAEKLSDILWAFAKPFEALAGMFKSVGRMFDSAKAYIDAKRSTIAVNNFIKVAASILILAFAIEKIAKINVVGLIVALTAIGILIVEIQVLTHILVKNTANPGTYVAIQGSLSLLAGMAILIFIMMKSFMKMADLSYDQIGKATLGMVGLMSIVTLFIVVMRKLYSIPNQGIQLTEVGAIMIGLGIAMQRMVAAVKVAGEMDLGVLKRGLLVVGGLMTFILLITRVMRSGFTELKGTGGIGIAFIGIALAIKILIGCVNEAASIEDGELLQASKVLAAFAGIMAVMIVITSFGGGKNASLTILAWSGAFMILPLIIKEINALGLDQVEYAINIIKLVQGAFALLLFFSKFAGKYAVRGAVVITAATLMMGLMVPIIGVLTYMASKDPKAMWQGVAVIAIIMGLMALLVGLSGINLNDGNGAKGTIIAVGIVVALLSGVAVALGIVPTEILITGILAVVVVLLAMSLMLKAAGSITKNKVSIGGLITMLVGMAILIAEVGVIVLAMTLATSMFGGMFNVDNLIKIAASIAMIIAAIGFAMGFIMGNMPKNKRMPKGALGTILAMMAVMGLLCVGMALALKLIFRSTSGSNKISGPTSGGGGMDVTDMLITVATSVILLAVLALMAAKLAEFTTKIGNVNLKESSKLLVVAVELGALLIGVAALIKLLQSDFMTFKTPDADFIKSLATMIGVLILLTGVAALITVIANKSTGSFGTQQGLVLMIVELVAILAEVGLAFKALEWLDVKATDLAVLGELIGVMLGLSVVAGVLMLISNGTKSTIGKQQEIMLMFAEVALIAWFISATVMPALNSVDSDNIVPAAGALAIVMLTLSIISGIMAGAAVALDPSLGDIFGMIGEGGMLFIVAAIAAFVAENVFDDLNKVDSDNIIPAAIALGAVMVALAVVLGIIGGVVKAVGAMTTLKAAAVMGVMAFIGEILAAIAAEYINWRGEEMMTNLEAMTVHMGPIGENVAAFFDAIQAMTADENAKDKINTVVDIIKEITRLAVLKDLFDWFGVIDNAAEEFNDIFTKLAEGFNGMFEAMEKANIDPELVSKFAETIKPILSLQMMMYGSGGAVQFILGEKDLSKFGSQLGEFAKGCATLMYYLANGVNVDGQKYKAAWGDGTRVLVENFCHSIEPIIELQKTLYGTDGIKQYIFGDKSFTDFITDVVTAYPHFAQFMKSVAAGQRLYNEEHQKYIQNFANCMTTITKACTSIPNEGGLLGDIFGENSPEQFGSDIKGLADGMYDLAWTISLGQHNGYWDTTAFETFGDCISIIGKIIKDDIPTNKDGWWNILSSTLHPDIPKFSTDIVSLGDAVADLNTSLNGKASLFIDGSIVTIFSNLKATLNNLPTDTEVRKLLAFLGDSSRGNFDENLGKLGSAIAAFTEPLISLNSSNVASSSSSLTLLTEALKNASAVDFANLENYGGNLTNLGTTTVDGFVAAFEGSYAKCAQGVSSFAKNLEDAYGWNGKYRMIFLGRHMAEDINEGLGDDKKEQKLRDTAGSLASAIYGVFDSYKGTAYQIGYDVAEGLINGMNSKVEDAKKAVDNMTNFIGPRMKDNLKEQSPSKLTYEIGAYVGEGLANGMMSTLTTVKDATDALSEESVSAINNALINTYNAFDQETFNPTITPVLDMSNVQNGFSYINGMLDNSIIGLAARNLSVSSDMSNYDVIDTLNNLGETLGTGTVNNYNVNGITYDDGSNVASAVGQLIYAANIARRS